jgi:Secretion system C-terminal sorting domain
MKKLSILVFTLVSISGFSQSKQTAIVALNTEMTAQFTLDNSTSKVTLVVTGPSAKWTSLGIGTASSTTSGDVFVYTTSVTENTITSANTGQDWSTVSNTVASGVRTVTLERTLTNSDLNDLQLAFDTTNSIDIVWSRSGSAIATPPNVNRGSKTVTFSSTLSTNDVSLDDDEIILYPNPTSGELYIKTKNNLSKINVYNQSGALIKTISVENNSNELKVSVDNLPKALYFFELQTDVKKVWKKVLVD